MTGRVARLSADLVANTTRFESGLARANRSMSRAKQSWNSDLNKAGRNFSQFGSQVKRSVGSVVDLRTQIGGIAAVTASALSVRKIIQYSDTWKQLEGRLRIVESGIQGVTKAQEDLFEIAQRTRQPLEGIVSFYTRLKQFVPEAERAQYDFLGVTESVAAALAITGESGASASAAMIQFTQAIGTNFESAGQEIRSLQEQAPRLTKALVDALGGGTKSLKQLQKEGVLTRKSVLEALGSMGTEARKLAKELEKIPLTVGQAVQRLDNAFLKFIGQTDAVKSGTSSLALFISELANNFDLLARAVGGVAIVVAIRLVGSLTASATAFFLAQKQAFAYQLTLARMAGVSATAATSQLTLAGATSRLGASLALLGGPLGVTIIAAYAAFSLQARRASKAQEIYNAEMSAFRQKSKIFITASDEVRRKIQDDVTAKIKAYQSELKALDILINRYADLDNKSIFDKLGLGIVEGLGKLGIGNAPSDVLKQSEELQKSIQELEDIINQPKQKPQPSSNTEDNKLTKKEKKIKKIIDGLKAESEELELQVKLYGQKESVIDRAQKALEIQQKLEQEGIKLTKEQQAAIEKYLDSIERQTELQAEQAEQQKELEQRERDRRQALNQLGATFESAFEKAITDGEKLSDVLQSLLDDILNIITRVTITEPLGNAVADIFSNIGKSSSSSGGGTGESIFSSIGGFFGDLFGGSFATGIDNVPRDMYAKLHKGEAVVTAADNRDGVAGDIIVNVYDSDGNKQSSTREKQNGNNQIDIDLTIAENISRKGSKSSQAINGILNQSRIRR